MLFPVPQIVVFIGPEGSGKTTQALKLKNETSWPYISTGDIIRNLAATDFTTKYGEECRKLAAEHGYLSGQSLVEILALRLKEEDTAGGFILDGGMRTVEETEKFQWVLETADRKGLPLKTILLQTSDEICIERLAGEGGRKRADDTKEGVQKRLSNYHHRLEDRLALIRKQQGWDLKEVNASQEIDKVFSQVLEALLKNG